VFPVVKYACESWTLNQDLVRRIDAFEQWCYRRILKVKWIDKVSNDKVLQRMQQSEMYLHKSIIKQKMSFAGHILRGSSGEDMLKVLEGRINSKNCKGRPRRMWLDDVKEWSGLQCYESIKRLAENRHSWRNICLNLACQPSDPEDDRLID
jgi:hypothetical protein